MGPLLQNEFERQLQNLAVTPDAAIKEGNSESDIEPETQSGQPATTLSANDLTPTDPSSSSRPKAQVGLISHIGGHKWAGNVIIYIPPSWRFNPSHTEEESLAGCGIWYGRVEPKHVEGIIKETVLGGRVIHDLFRGGVNQDGEVLRIPLELGKTKKESAGTPTPDEVTKESGVQGVNDLSAI